MKNYPHTGHKCKQKLESKGGKLRNSKNTIKLVEKAMGFTGKYVLTRYTLWERVYHKWKVIELSTLLSTKVVYYINE